MGDVHPVGNEKRLDDPIEKASVDPVEQVDLNRNLEAK